MWRVFRRGLAGFSRVSEQDVAAFRSIVATPAHVITDPDQLESFNRDWMRSYTGRSQVAVAPSTTDQVSRLLAYMNERRLPVVVQGGNTGLVGGSIPEDDEVILLMGKMDRVMDIDADSGILQCEAGCILENLDNALTDHGLMMPLDLGSKGSCQIGGNIATNAGGIRLFRYGSLHGNVLGLEVVRADGEVLDCMSTMRKDNTGYHLRSLFVGAEGTLGVITRAAILCPARPAHTSVAFLGCSSFDKVLDTFRLARTHLTDLLSAVEFLDHEAIMSVCENLGYSLPFEPCPQYMLLELSGMAELQACREQLDGFLAKAMESRLVLSGTVAEDSVKVQSLWKLRESVAEALLRDGYCYKYDLSLPHRDLYRLVALTRERLGASARRVVGYGHLGDGGSISAEHGVGRHKRRFLHLNKSPAALRTMQLLKRTLDPRGILNPAKTLPPAPSSGVC